MMLTQNKKATNKENGEQCWQNVASKKSDKISEGVNDERIIRKSEKRQSKKGKKKSGKK